VLVDLRESSATVAPRILDLLAKLRERLALPAHLMRCHAPERMARYPRGHEIGDPVNRRAILTKRLRPERFEALVINKQ
jgi:hypothetical protein